MRLCINQLLGNTEAEVWHEVTVSSLHRKNESLVNAAFSAVGGNLTDQESDPSYQQ